MKRAESQTLEPGIVLRDTYLIVEPLAFGGMGEIYLATHVRLPGRFAVKVLSAAWSRDPDAVARFCREAAIISILRHPNIVQVFDFNVTLEGIPYLVMECLDGMDLADRLVESGPMPLGRVVRIISQAAGALEAAHARGIVHRDLKPENIVLTDWEGQRDFVKVLDFGISKISGSERVTNEWTVLGTPAFMAPEQATGQSESVDGRTDEFALAALTFVLLTGRDPFPGKTAPQVLHKVVHAEPEALAPLLPWPAGPIEAVLRKAMSKRREDRYEKILDFAGALEGAAAEVTPAVRPGPVAAPAPMGGAAAAGGGTTRRTSADGYGTRRSDTHRCTENLDISRGPTALLPREAPPAEEPAPRSVEAVVGQSL